MPHSSKIKKIIYWIEATTAILLFLSGLFTTVWLLLGASSLAKAIPSLSYVYWHNVKYAATEIWRMPGLYILPIVGCFLFVYLLFSTAQTDREKRMIKYLVGGSLLGAFLTANGLVAYVMALMVSQGAGT